MLEKLNLWSLCLWKAALRADLIELFKMIHELIHLLNSARIEFDTTKHTKGHTTL